MTRGSADAKRSFLFLQGLGSCFFARLAAALDVRGYPVLKVNFSGGDRHFWGPLPSVDFNGHIRDLGNFIEEIVTDRSITDVILFGDCRPIHRVSIAVAKRRGCRIHVFEEGYVRPNWITLEQDGVNAHSRLPRDPQFYMDQASALGMIDPRDGAPVGSGFRKRVLDDFRYQFATLFSWTFRNYKSHRPNHILTEYVGWARRLALARSVFRGHARKVQNDLIDNDKRFYLLPLQLDTDYQIRVHSPFGRIMPFLSESIRSFAKHAPGDTLLVIKNHPLDNGLLDYRKRVARLARRYGVADRVLFIDGGDLPQLLHHTLGVVVVNSTVGISALLHGRPTITLGSALYNIPGLTFQGQLADFWCNATAPDQTLFRAFRRCLIHFSQINGNFYTTEGQDLAINGALHRLEANHPLESAMVRPAALAGLIEQPVVARAAAAKA